MSRFKSFEFKVDRSRIEGTILSVDSERDRMLLSCLFLTGARVSEVVRRLRASDVTVDGDFAFITLVTLKRRGYEARLPRTVPVSLNKESLARSFVIWSQAQLGVLFPFSRQHAWRIVKKYFDLEFPHYFRHARSTLLLREIPNFQYHDLKVFHNWTSQSMADVYAHSELKDVLDKMR